MRSRAPAREPLPEGSDAIERTSAGLSAPLDDGATAVAALEAGTATAPVGEGVETLVATAKAGGDPLELLLSAWRLLRPGVPPRLTGEAAQRLRQAAARVDRYAAFGAGRQGVAVELAVERMRLEAGGRDEYGFEEPPPSLRLESLGGYAAWLAQLGREWRRTALGRQQPPRPALGRRPPHLPRRGPWKWPQW